MKFFSRRVLGRVYVLVTLFCASYLILQGVRHSSWYSQRLYRQLLAGSEAEQRYAASALAQIGAQGQLLEALHADNARARDLAQRGLEYLWFNSAGSQAYQLLADAYAASIEDQPQQALILLNTLTSRFPKFAEGWNRRASVHWKLGEFAQSQSDCERALALNPQHYGAWQGIGLCQLQSGDVAGACQSLRTALKILPHDHATQVSLRRCEELLRTYPPVRRNGRGNDVT